MRFADLPAAAQATVLAATGQPRIARRKREDGADKLAVQLAYTALAGRYVREYRFHAIRKWRVDIAFPEVKLAIEVDGFAAGGKAGRHQRPAGVSADNEKYAELAIAGFRLIRVTTRQVRSGEAIAWIARAV